MSNEEIVKEIDEATNLMTEAKVKMNVALNLARGAIMKGNTVDTEAYNKGLEDAWELARKICGATDGKYDNFSTRELCKIFDMSSSAHIINENTYQEALAKLEAYEKEQAEIKVEVGDVVKLQGEMVTEFVVTNIFSSRNYISYNGIASDGKFVADARNVEKTGKHIDIQSVLEQIKE